MQLLFPPKHQLHLFQSLPKNQNPPKCFTDLQWRNPSRACPASIRTEQESGEDADSNGLLVVKRPVRNPLLEEEGESLQEESSSLGLETVLNEFAKKMPMFEPLERVDVGPVEKPLAVNLELWLYRGKAFGRKFQFSKAEKILAKCIHYWPEDGRAYVALGKYLCKQGRYDEAKEVYERGSQATQGENSYIWQCWAVMESKLGKVKRARDLFDAATVADKRHGAAWHAWAVLEIKEGNMKKARDLLRKCLKFCGPSEYVYHTLALLENRANRIPQARYLFQQATVCNPKSCASWLAWAQLEVQQENPDFARKLFERALQSSPKNRFTWHVWAMFEAEQGDIDRSRKLLKIGHALNPRDPVLIQSLALLEYKQSAPHLARALFKRASVIDPKHQPVWMAWGWMEWKEGNIEKAREYYQRVLSIDPNTETASRCLQAWGVLEQRNGNLTTARGLLRSSLNVNSQSYTTWMTWASLEEEQGNEVRAEEIRNQYFQQRIEVVDDASWVMGFRDIVDPAVDAIGRLLKLDKNTQLDEGMLSNLQGSIQGFVEGNLNQEDSRKSNQKPVLGSITPQQSDEDSSDEEEMSSSRKEVSFKQTALFDLDAFVKDRLHLDPSMLDDLLVKKDLDRAMAVRRIWKNKASPVRT